MKISTTIMVAVVSMLFLPGCSKMQKENEKLRTENQILKSGTQERDSIINAIFNSYVEIEKNLAAISRKQNFITGRVADPERMSRDIRDRISDDIKVINYLMEENRKRIESIRTELDSSALQLEAFNETVSQLVQRAADKEMEITELKYQLTTLNFKIESLNTQLSEMEIRNQNQVEIIEITLDELDLMNTVWYAVGSKKYLIDNGIIERDGRFLRNDLDVNPDMESKFILKSDLRMLNRIPVNSTKAVLMTPHDDDSYEWVRQDDMINFLRIMNQDAFWRISRFCVIQVN